MSMTRALLRALSVLLAVALFVPVTLVPTARAVDSRSESTIRDRLERKINRTRARHGLRRLKVSLYVQREANRHAEKMSRHRYLFHDYNAANEMPRDAEAWAENIGRTTAANAARRLHRMFMRSSTHRRNILRKRWTHMGIGVAKRGRYTYAVERFLDRR